VVYEPTDWLARCILANDACATATAGANAQLDALPRRPRPARLRPRPLLFALRLHRAAGRSDTELLAFIAHTAVPKLAARPGPPPPRGEAAMAGVLPGRLPRAGHFPELKNFWLPAAALCAQILADPRSEAELLVWLGLIEQGQLDTLREMTRRGLIDPADAATLNKDLEDRIRQTWELLRSRNGPPRCLRRPGPGRASRGDAGAACKRSTPACKPAASHRTARVQSRLLRASTPARDWSRSSAWRNCGRKTCRSGSWWPTRLAPRPARQGAGGLPPGPQLRPDLDWACRLEARLRLDQGRPTAAVEALARSPAASSRTRTARTAPASAGRIRRGGEPRRADGEIRTQTPPAGGCWGRPALCSPWIARPAAEMAELILKDQPESGRLCLKATPCAVRPSRARLPPGQGQGPRRSGRLRAVLRFNPTTQSLPATSSGCI